MHPALRRLDLNLLLVFDALFRHRSVTTAANEIAISPSAMSHALARLRDALGDELFVRFGNEMQPTVRAEDMAGFVGEALDVLSKGMQRAHRFEPERSTHTFVFAATDYTAFAVLPAFIARIQRVAPQLRFRIVYSGRKIATRISRQAGSTSRSAITKKRARSRPASRTSTGSPTTTS